MHTEPASPPDLVSKQLAALEEQLRAELAGHATVGRAVVAGHLCVDITPENSLALPVSWWDSGFELGVQAGHEGGRFELGRTEEDVAYLESLIRSVIAGRVVEVFAPARSRVDITFADGQVTHETGYNGCLLIPLPGWRRWGRRTHYVPYR